MCHMRVTFYTQEHHNSRSEYTTLFLAFSPAWISLERVGFGDDDERVTGSIFTRLFAFTGNVTISIPDCAATFQIHGSVLPLLVSTLALGLLLFFK